MKYAENIDYLVSSIIYLGTHDFYWARSAHALARELSLDEGRLHEVFLGFPGLFRRSERLSEQGQYYFALQARYAQREGGDIKDPEEISRIEPLDGEKLKMLLDFVLKMSEHEMTDRRQRWTHIFSITAAVLSAITAIIVATGAISGKRPQKASMLERHEFQPATGTGEFRFALIPVARPEGIALRRIKSPDSDVWKRVPMKPHPYQRPRPRRGTYGARDGGFGSSAMNLRPAPRRNCRGALQCDRKTLSSHWCCDRSNSGQSVQMVDNQ